MIQGLEDKVIQARLGYKPRINNPTKKISSFIYLIDKKIIKTLRYKLFDWIHKKYVVEQK